MHLSGTMNNNINLTMRRDALYQMDLIANFYLQSLSTYTQQAKSNQIHLDKWEFHLGKQWTNRNENEKRGWNEASGDPGTVVSWQHIVDILLLGRWSYVLEHMYVHKYGRWTSMN